MKNLFVFGITLIVIGIFILLGSFIQLSKMKKKAEGGFVVFIGPIPIVGATSKLMFYLMLILSITLLIISIFLIR